MQGYTFQQKGTDNTLDLTRLMQIASLLTQRVKFVKEQDTAVGTYMIKEPLQTDSGFPKVCPNHAFISNN